MSKIKLYTEEQVKKAIELAQEGYGWDGEFYLEYVNHETILEKLTPIELPSDEEIEKNNPYEYLVGSKYYSPQNLKYWEEGAKWVLEQIKQQDNGK